MSKQKKSTDSGGKRGAGGRSGDLGSASPPAPIPDFDHIEFRQLAASTLGSSAEIVKLLNTVTKACEAIKSEDALSVLATSDVGTKIQAACKQLATDLPRHCESLSAFAGKIEEWEVGEKRSRRSRFEHYVREKGWDVAGSWPEPVVARVVFVVVDEQKGRATVNGRACPSPATAERLVAQCAEELLSLMEGRCEPQEFVGQVWEAYQSRGGQPNSGIPVYDLLAEMLWQRQSKTFVRDPRAELFKAYRVAQFRADLTHYLATGAPPITSGASRYRLEVVGGSYAQDGLFIYLPQTQRLATCGRLVFKAEG